MKGWLKRRSISEAINASEQAEHWEEMRGRLFNKLIPKEYYYSSPYSGEYNLYIIQLKCDKYVIYKCWLCVYVFIYIYNFYCLHVTIIDKKKETFNYTR